MSNVLTSWKEIGRYLGRGVRTVQRWEANFSLPVRRARNDGHRAVLAITDELDAWAVNRTETSMSQLQILRSELAKLREEFARLQEENAGLRQRLIESAPIPHKAAPPRTAQHKGMNPAA